MWKQYGAKQTFVLNEAFAKGHTQAQFVMSNFQCTVNFHTMTQKFKQNGVQRAVDMIPLAKPTADDEQVGQYY